jgi:ferritin-like metal-binding protein YciE
MATTKKNRLENLQDLYVHELKDIYSAEQQITKALPKLIKKASSQELKQSFEKHLKETEDQINRLDEIFQRLEEKSAGQKCAGMEGLLKEGEDLLKEDASPEVLDAGMIVAAQKVEHYEIAAYGSLCTFAESLGFDEDLELLKQTIEEEKMTDEKLTELAESGVNDQSQ